MARLCQCMKMKMKIIVEILKYEKLTIRSLIFLDSRHLAPHRALCLQIPAVHDFSLFMSLIVSCCWLWVSILMPAALCIWNQCAAAHLNACPKW